MPTVVNVLPSSVFSGAFVLSASAGGQLLLRGQHVGQAPADLPHHRLDVRLDRALDAALQAAYDSRKAQYAEMDASHILFQARTEAEFADLLLKEVFTPDTITVGFNSVRFDDEFVRQIIQKITVEDAETIRVHFRGSDVVLEQEVE